MKFAFKKFVGHWSRRCFGVYQETFLQKKRRKSQIFGLKILLFQKITMKNSLYKLFVSVLRGKATKIFGVWSLPPPRPHRTTPRVVIWHETSNCYNINRDVWKRALECEVGLSSEPRWPPARPLHDGFDPLSKFCVDVIVYAPFKTKWRKGPFPWLIFEIYHGMPGTYHGAGNEFCHFQKIWPV